MQELHIVDLLRNAWEAHHTPQCSEASEKCCWMSYLLLYEVSVAMHGEVHEPDGAVIHEGISILAVQVGLTAHCEDHACMPTAAHLQFSSTLTLRVSGQTS